MIQYLENGIEVNGEFISLQDITEKCNSLQIEKEDLAILKIEWHGRGGDSYEHRVYPKETAKRLKELLIGKFAYLGEVWGKHSEVCGDLEDNHITIEDNKEKVKEFLLENPGSSDASDYFIESVLEWYDEQDGEENNEEEYCKQIEEIRELW